MNPVQEHLKSKQAIEFDIRTISTIFLRLKCKKNFQNQWSTTSVKNQYIQKYLHLLFKFINEVKFTV